MVDAIVCVVETDHRPHVIALNGDKDLVLAIIALPEIGSSTGVSSGKVETEFRSNQSKCKRRTCLSW